VRKLSLLEVGSSTIGAMKWWIDRSTGRLNRVGQGDLLGEFDTGDYLLLITRDGQYGIYDVDENFYYDPKMIQDLAVLYQDSVISAVYHEGDKGWTMVKRFEVEHSSVGQLYPFITDHRSSKLYYATAADGAQVTYTYKAQNQKHTKELDLDSFVDIKGWKALGNKLGEFKILSIKAMVTSAPTTSPKDDDDDQARYKPGDTIELDL